MTRLEATNAAWRTLPLKAYFRRESTRGAPDETLLSVYREFGVIPKDSRNDNFNRASLDLSNYLLVHPGDLVVNKMKAWQGSLAISTLRGIVSPAYFVYRPVGEVEGRFIHHLLRSARVVSVMKSISKGIRPGQWDLDPAVFAQMALAVPSLAEQRAIADYLDRETAQIDTLIAKQEQLIATLRERRLAAIDHAVARYSPDRLSRIATTYTSTIDKHSRDGQRAVRLCNYVDVYKNTSITSALVFMAATASDDEVDRFRLKLGDTIVTKDSESADDIGVPAYVEYESDDLVCGYHLAIVRPGPEVVPKYLYWALDSRLVRRQWSVLASGVTRVGIRRNDLRRVQIPLPPLEEQREIADRLDAETAKIDALIEKAERFIVLAKERRAALITAAVTGQIDVTEKAA